VLAKIRAKISEAAGGPMIVSRQPIRGAAVMSFVTREDLADVAGRGPATPTM